MGKNTKALRQIYDNIYGYINFSRNKFDFILKDPFFLRLHNIKQMGLAYYVYPDALHTRFAHSLGVYSNVCRIINSPEREGMQENEDDVYKIQLSALLHDIGHVPLSHAIEKALDDFEKLEACEGLKSEDSCEKEEGVIEEEVPITENPESNEPTSQKHPKIALHERLGEVVLSNCPIGKQLEDMGISPYEISAGFKGDFGDAYLQEHSSSASQTFFSRQIRNFLHSQLDADRIDYLLRDASFSGVNTGSIDTDKLLNSIFYDDKNNYGIDFSAVRALDQFFISRYVAYCQIVGNKKVMAFEYMASDFYYRLLKMRKEQKYHLGLRLYSYRDLANDILPNNPEEFLTFTDDYFFSLIRTVLANRDSVERQDEMVVIYADMITKGKALTPVFYIEGFEIKLKERFGDKGCFIKYLYDESRKESSEVLDEIANSAGIAKSEIIIPEPKKISIFKKDEDPIYIFENRKVIYNNVSDSPASLLWMLEDMDYYIYRVYTTNDACLVNLGKALRDFARKHDFTYLGDLEMND